MKIEINLSGLPCVAEGEWNDYGYFVVEELRTDLGEDISPVLGSIGCYDLVQRAIEAATKEGER